MTPSPKPSVLFVLRRREHAWGQCDPTTYNSSGLRASALLVARALEAHGHRCGLAEVTDGNCVDREVTKFDPDVVVLEAVWCPPAKLAELVALPHHCGRTWAVRNHSKLPFLALEGVSIGWLIECARIPGVYATCNSTEASRDLEVLSGKHVPCLPNCYPEPFLPPKFRPMSDAVDVGCFGAVRPLKNHAAQAVGAIAFARRTKRRLRFHVNASRLECGGDPVLKSLRTLFTAQPDAELVEHPWMDRMNFLKVCEGMDLGMQVSYSETFSIVAADMVSRGVPVVGSQEIPWLHWRATANPNYCGTMPLVLEEAEKTGAGESQRSLREYSRKSEGVWAQWLEARGRRQR